MLHCQQCFPSKLLPNGVRNAIYFPQFVNTRGGRLEINNVSVCKKKLTVSTVLPSDMCPKNLVDIKQCRHMN